jgi:hypothetical protein
MRKLLWSAAIALAITATASAAQASPAAPQIENPNDNIVKVRDLCGLGWHRGPYGYCRPNGTGYGPYPVYGPPRCWWVGTPYGTRRVCAW